MTAATAFWIRRRARTFVLRRDFAEKESLRKEVEEDAAGRRFLPAGPHRHRLRLVADGVDRPGELIHGMAKRDVQEVDRRGRRLGRGEIMPEIVERQFPCRVFQKEDQIGDRPHAGLGKGAPVLPPLEAVREIVHETAQTAVGDALIEGKVPLRLFDHDQIEAALEFPEEQGVGIDAARGVIAEEVAGHRVQDHGKRQRRAGDADHRIGDRSRSVPPPRRQKRPRRICGP